MGRLKIVSLFIFCSVFYGLLFSCSSNKNTKRLTRQEATRNLQNKFIKKVCKEYDLDIYGIGGGSVDAITGLTYHFQIREYKQEKEMRGILINLIDRLTDMINQDKDIRPYLAEYPFPKKRLKISLTYPINITKKISLPHPTRFSYYHGKIHYSHMDYEKEYLPMSDIKEEKYPAEEN